MDHLIETELTGIFNNQLHHNDPNTETVVGYNEGIDPPPPQYISNVFAAADLSSQS